jgi:hypothetical protein
LWVALGTDQLLYHFTKDVLTTNGGLSMAGQTKNHIGSSRAYFVLQEISKLLKCQAKYQQS